MDLMVVMMEDEDRIQNSKQTHIDADEEVAVY